MKLTKKLIPAIGMLMLSMVMLVTSSFAWFSMNDTVKATGMTVSAKGDQIYLQIINEDGTFTAGAAQTTAAGKTAQADTLKPTNVKTKSGDTYGNYNATSGYVWVSAIGKDATDGAAVDGKYAEVSSGDIAAYALVNTFKIRLDKTAGAIIAPGALRVSSVSFAKNGEEAYTPDALGTSVSVLVVCGDYSQLYTQAGTDGVFTQVAGSSANLSANGEGKFDSTDGVSVQVYVFFNGDDADCTLQKLAAATTQKYSVEVSFTCSKVS